jgi:hypothetical protein
MDLLNNLLGTHAMIVMGSQFIDLSLYVSNVLSFIVMVWD